MNEKKTANIALAPKTTEQCRIARNETKKLQKIKIVKTNVETWTHKRLKPKNLRTKQGCLQLKNRNNNIAGNSYTTMQN